MNKPILVVGVFGIDGVRFQKLEQAVEISKVQVKILIYRSLNELQHGLQKEVPDVIIVDEEKVGILKSTINDVCVGHGVPAVKIVRVISNPYKAGVEKEDNCNCFWLVKPLSVSLLGTVLRGFHILKWATTLQQQAA